MAAFHPMEPMMHTDSDAALIARINALTEPLEPQPTAASPSIEPLAGIRAVLFDIYGTLVISGCGDIGLTAPTTAHAAFLGAWSAAGLDTTRLPASFDGPSALTAEIRAEHAASRDRGVGCPEVNIIAVWQALLATCGVAAAAEQVRRLALEYELRTNPVWPMPGLRATLRTLAERGLVLGVVSNAQFYTPLILHAFLGQPMQAAGFDLRCCAFSYREGVAKPSTEVYVPALHGLWQHRGIDPASVLYVGNDMRNDVQPARALGCRTALFAGDARSLRLRTEDAELRDIAPDRVVTELNQITSALLPGA
ncbi:MAG: HAD family hydrolase [Thiohalocapsa sp.]|jgi:putative hydrolase of the HAD superfamily